MSAALKFWLVFLFVSFGISVLMLSAVQTRLIRREGWSVFRRRSLIQLYWRELSSRQRWLLWPGVAAFFLTWLAAMIITVLHHIIGNGTPHI